MASRGSGEAWGGQVNFVVVVCSFFPERGFDSRHGHSSQAEAYAPHVARATGHPFASFVSIRAPTRTLLYNQPLNTHASPQASLDKL